MKIWIPLLLLSLAPVLGWSAKSTNATEKSDLRAHAAVRNGQFIALEVLIADALQRVPGEVIDVELDDDEYEIEILDAEGVVWELEYDARSGGLQEMERDD